MSDRERRGVNWSLWVWTTLLALFCLVSLAAILFQMIAKVHTSGGRQRKSLTRMKILAIGIQIYTTDYEDRLPVIKHSGEYTGLGWAGRIAAYTKDPNLLFPGSRTSRDATSPPQDDCDVAMNAETAKLLNSVAVDMPSTGILLFNVTAARAKMDATDATLKRQWLSPVGDGTAEGLKNSLTAKSPIRYAIGMAKSPNDAGPQYSGYSNIAFLDGHVKMLTGAQFVAWQKAGKVSWELPKDPDWRPYRKGEPGAPPKGLGDEIEPSEWIPRTKAKTSSLPRRERTDAR